MIEIQNLLVSQILKAPQHLETVTGTALSPSLTTKPSSVHPKTLVSHDAWTIIFVILVTDTTYLLSSSFCDPYLYKVILATLSSLLLRKRVKLSPFGSILSSFLMGLLGKWKKKQIKIERRLMIGGHNTEWELLEKKKKKLTSLIFVADTILQQRFSDTRKQKQDIHLILGHSSWWCS